MDHFADYLRDEAAKYRQLAEAAEEAFRKEELLSILLFAPADHIF